MKLKRIKKKIRFWFPQYEFQNELKILIIETNLFLGENVFIMTKAKTSL